MPPSGRPVKFNLPHFSHPAHHASDLAPDLGHDAERGSLEPDECAPFMSTGAPIGRPPKWAQGVKNTLSGKRGSADAGAKGLQYDSGEGCHLAFRTGVVVLVGMKLFGIGCAVTLVAAAGLTVEATRSCALSASICLIAASFYTKIYAIRRQGWTGGPYYQAALSPRTTQPTAMAAEDDLEPTVHQRLFVQENAVDALRKADWTITLALMAIETDTLLNELAPTRAAPIGPFISALLQSSLVQIGTIGRSYFNDGRVKSREGRGSWSGVAVTIVCFLLASAMWVATTWSVLEHIGPLTAETYPNAADRSEATVLYVLAIAQVVYPLTASLDFLWMYKAKKNDGNAPYEHNEYSATLSTLKDLLYGFSDVVTKGGLALVSFQKATRS